MGLQLPSIVPDHCRGATLKDLGYTGCKGEDPHREDAAAAAAAAAVGGVVVASCGQGKLRYLCVFVHVCVCVCTCA